MNIKENINRSEMRINSAKTVLNNEGLALLAMAKKLDEKDFSKAFIDTLKLMDKIVKAGRVVVVGMGKSGHVGKKIAATLASMGTVSFFVHPSEAAHGDMGMITKNDMVILISNSGESKELFPVKDYCVKFNIPIVALTRSGTSTIDKVAAIKLTMPNIPECCPIGKAPTTSMIMTMALGDALSVVMAERNGLNSEQYKHWHPGGKLGNSLMKIKQVMNEKNKISIVKNSESLDSVLTDFQNEKFADDSKIAIVDNNAKMIGQITHSNIIKNMHKKDEMNAEHILSEAHFVDENDGILEAMKIFEETSNDFCFVCKNEKPIGFITVKDILEAKK